MKKKQTPVCQKVELDNFFSCKVVAGKPHKRNCDIERCSDVAVKNQVVNVLIMTSSLLDGLVFGLESWSVKH